MTENELHELNRLPEIDPDYEGKKTEAAQAKEKIKFRTLFLPVLFIITSAWSFLPFPSSGRVSIFITVLGLAGSGIVPTALIVRYKLDTSKYFPVKMILFALTVSGAVFALLANFIGPVLLGAALIGELALALFSKTDKKTKLCLFLSNGVWGFLGFLLDLLF